MRTSYGAGDLTGLQQNWVHSISLPIQIVQVVRVTELGGERRREKHENATENGD